MQLREVLQKPDFTCMAFTGVRGDERLSLKIVMLQSGNLFEKFL